MAVVSILPFAEFAPDLNIQFSVEQLREEIETLRGQVEDEQGNGDMLQRGLFRNFLILFKLKFGALARY